MRTLVRVAPLLLLLPLVGCRTRLLDDGAGHIARAPLTSDPWPLPAHDPQRSNRGSTSGPSVAGGVWRSMDLDILDGCSGGAQPLVARDGTIYVVSADGTLFAFSPVDGQLRFESKFNLSPVNAAIGSDGTIYIGSAAPGVGPMPIVAVDAASGKTRWTTSVCRASFGFVGADGNLYGVCWPEGPVRFGTSLFSLRPDDGSLRFRTDAGNVEIYLLEGLDGTIISIDQQNHASTFDPSSGALKLQMGLQKGCDTCLEVSTNGILHCREDCLMHLDAKDIATGNVLWRSVDGFIPGGTVWAEGGAGQLYILQGTNIQVYDAQGTGAVVALPVSVDWSRDIVPSISVDADGAVYVYQATQQGTSLSVFEPTGETRFVTMFDDQGWFPGGTLAIGDGILYGVTCHQSFASCNVNPCHLVAFGSRP